ncbi:MAG: M48 family metalloprotease, partial [Rhodocyclales bacterium]|nr:M48 family metalloprotease [Rhodocyclales bacterium]
MVTNLGVNVLGAVLGVDSSGLGKLAQLGIGLPHSRAHETEADRMGVELAARAGYDPRAAIGLWQKMARAGGGQGPEWMSTHPSSQSRIEDLRVYAARVLPLYEQAATQHARPVK